MSKRLKLLLSISCLFILNICYSQLDSLRYKKKQGWLHFDVGIPIYNKFNISYSLTFKDFYWVNSKIKPLLNLGYNYSFKRFNLGFSTSYLQNEFIGKPFIISEKDKFGNYYYKFNVHQKIRYDFAQFNLSFGYNKWVSTRQNINVNAEVFFSYFYKVQLSNYYSNEQYGFDTTAYTLAKNVNSAKFYNLKIPRGGLSFNYSYLISNKFAVNVAVVNYFLLFNDFSGLGSTVFDSGKGWQYYFEAYDINKHFLIATTIGLKYRLK